MVIEAIHESVLNHLLKNEQVNFSLRSKDKRNEDKLSKGYWFLGNENYLAISFWNSRDWRNKTPNIFFGIDSAGWTWLEFIDKDGGVTIDDCESVSNHLNKLFFVENIE